MSLAKIILKLIGKIGENVKNGVLSQINKSHPKTPSFDSKPNLTNKEF